MKKKMPFLKDHLLRILSNESINLETFSNEEKYFIEKIKHKKYNKENKCLKDNDDNKSQHFSFFDEEPNLQDSFEDLKYPTLQVAKRSSQFEVNIDGIMP